MVKIVRKDFGTLGLAQCNSFFAFQAISRFCCDLRGKKAADLGHDCKGDMGLSGKFFHICGVHSQVICCKRFCKEEELPHK